MKIRLDCLPGTVSALAAWILLLLPIHSMAAGRHAGAAVVVSSEIRPYMQALDGFRDGFSRPFDTFFLSANPEFVRHNLSKNDYRIIVSIGPEASQTVWDTTGNDTARLSLMVLDPQELLHEKDPCSIDLRVPITAQLKTIKKELGTGLSCGILFNPSENASIVENAGRTAEETGIRLVPLPVKQRSEVIHTLAEAYGRIDVLLFIPDSTVTVEALVRYLIKEALLHGIAVVGYNTFFADMGAVMAFVVDYREVGRAGAELAGNMLENGGKCTRHPPPYQIRWNKKAWESIKKTK